MHDPAHLAVQLGSSSSDLLAGAGTIFRSCTFQQSEPIGLATGAAFGEKRSTMSRHVLVVDDDQELCETTSFMLEEMGFKVRFAYSGVVALEVLARDPEITLLLTDVQMPNMDGYDLSRHALSMRPDLSIVFMSGADHGREGFRFIHKPFSLAQLQEIVGPGYN